MAAKHDATGRSVGGHNGAPAGTILADDDLGESEVESKRGRHYEAHFRTPNWLYDCPAFKLLGAVERAIYQLVQRKFVGNNNGRIVIGVREAAAECHVNKDTAAKAFKVLEDAGFITNMRRGSYSSTSRLASEWRLTHLQCDVTGVGPAPAFMGSASIPPPRKASAARERGRPKTLN